MAPILEALHSHSPLLGLASITRSPYDSWGFEEIFPSTRAVDQEWFPKWELTVRRLGQTPFQREFENQVELETRDLRRVMQRQIHGIDEDATPYWRGEIR